MGRRIRVILSGAGKWVFRLLFLLLVILTVETYVALGQNRTDLILDIPTLLVVFMAWWIAEDLLD